MEASKSIIQDIKLQQEILPKHVKDQPTKTYSGYPITPPPMGLPKIVDSLCPECIQTIQATVYEDDGKVLMEKTCKEHGYFNDVITTNAKVYLEAESWFFGDGRGLTNPAVTNATNCPQDCGLCNMHQSHTALANIDLTNRCNLRCPICFANANVKGYVYEPDLETLTRMLQNLRDMKPIPCQHIQFTGGEPTIHPDWFAILKKAKELGFSQIQAATNGITMTNLEFMEKSKESGLDHLYLQMDGVTNETFIKTRGLPLLEKKLKVIDNVRKCDLRLTLVPTLVTGFNDHEIGSLIDLATKNADIISGINFQPIAFTGRVSYENRAKMRFTNGDLVRCVNVQTGLTNDSDWMPLSSIRPFAKLHEALTGKGTTAFSCSPHCSIGTYFFVGEDGKAVPMTKFFDFKKAVLELDELSRKAKKSKIKIIHKINTWRALKKYYNQEKAPKGLSFEKVLQCLDGYRSREYRSGEMAKKTGFPILFITSMHFQDSYNFDLNRNRRCVIHYSAPDNKMYPFCTYNCGPTFRDKIEREYSISMAEYKDKCCT